MRPDKQRQAEPGHAGSTHGMDSDDEIEPGKNRRKTSNKDTYHRQSNVGVRIDAAVRRVKRPAGIDSAGGRGREGKHAAKNINIPTSQVKAWKGEVARADHQRNQKISQDRRDRRDQEKENHRD